MTGPVESGARNKELIHGDGVRGASSGVGGREIRFAELAMKLLNTP